MWWLPVLGLLIGVAIGTVFSLTIPAQYSRYTAMALLAALDSVLGAVRAELDGKFDNRIFLTGFFVNIILAGTLTYLGDRLGVELYIAAIVAFGVRMFNNLAIIRRQLLERWAWPKRTQGADGD
ncbi:MAG: small basic family protein [Anaerolineae bacterium]